MGKFILNGIEYAGGGGGGGGGSSVIPNPPSAPTDHLSTIEIDNTVYDISTTGEKEIKNLIYTLTTPSQWMTFNNPNATNPLLLEVDAYGEVRKVYVNPDKLPSRSSGDNYLTITTIQSLGTPINMATIDDKSVIYISTNGSFDASIVSISVYEVTYIPITQDGVDLLYDSGSYTDAAPFGVDIPLLHNLSDYDLCTIVSAYPGDRADSRYWSSIYSTFIVKDLLSNDTGKKCILILGYDNRHRMADFTETTFNIRSNVGLDLSVYKIYGIKINNSIETDNNKIPLFKKGKWMNNNLVTLATSGATLQDNKLVFSGESVGICCEDVSGLASAGYGPYKIIFKMTDISHTIMTQFGRCTPNNNPSAIISAGTNRISYTNDTYTNQDYLVSIRAQSNAEGVFCCAGYQDPTTEFSIEEIYLTKCVERNY